MTSNIGSQYILDYQVKAALEGEFRDGDCISVDANGEGLIFKKQEAMITV
jgi:hypothetical protein